MMHGAASGRGVLGTGAALWAAGMICAREMRVLGWCRGDLRHNEAGCRADEKRQQAEHSDKAGERAPHSGSCWTRP